MAECLLPELGVGIVYSSAIEPLLRDDGGLIQVLEVEPQTMWLRESGEHERFKEPAGLLDYLAALPGQKLIHSVGAPVGGTVAPRPGHLELLRKWVERFRSPWMSEHLSFNATVDFYTGFFLAPRQTSAGVRAVADSIHRLKAAMPVPVAVETGVNYLRPRSDELLDGEFVNEVVREADCGILLDLHNVFTNALNGRQSVDEFLGRIPLDRVWEIHLAGGFEMDGFYLDGHSDVIPEQLIEIARRVVPALPNLGAIMFEVFPSYVPILGLDKIRRQLERMQEIWRGRGRSMGDGIFVSRAPASMPAAGSRETPAATPVHWEAALGGLVIGREPGGSMLAGELAAEPGVEIMRKLIREFRASMLVNVMRLTVRLLLLTLGEEGLRTILAAFWEKFPPQFYATKEAERFAEFLDELDLQIPQLGRILAFERALLATALDDLTRVVPFDFDPMPLLRALAEGRLPDVVGQPGEFEIAVTSDSVASESGLDPMSLGQSGRFH